MIRAALLFLLLSAQSAQAACRHALALGLDVSGSVDGTEYRQQLDGLATALNAPAVRATLFARPDAPIRITVYEWSGPAHKPVILPWIALSAPQDLARATATLRAQQRQPAPPGTAIGAALLAGEALLQEQPECWRHTLDLSGDGPSNTGERPQDVGPLDTSGDTIVNALVIAGTTLAPSADGGALSAYFRAYVIRGPGAFVETAARFDDYAAAMERKLLRELQSIAIGDARPY